MKNYNNRFIKDNNESITYIGRYGEDLMFSKQSDGTYLFSSFVLGLYDIRLPETSRSALINTYSVKGNSDFNKDFNDSISLSYRLHILGFTMKHLYDEYLSKKDLECFILIKQIIKDVEIFKLSKKKCIDYFITYGSSEDHEYINYILDLRKRIVKTRKHKYVIYSQTKIDIVAKTKIEALLLFWKEHKKEFKKIELIKKEETIYGDESIQG